jgi:hypothetical protein
MPPDRGPRWPLLLAVTVLLIGAGWATTPVRTVAARLVLAGGEAWRHPGRCRTQLVTPGAGEYALPAVTRTILQLQRRHGIDRYELSPRLAQSPLLYQRTVEASWPRRCDPGAPALFLTADEATNLPPDLPREVSDGIVLIRRD